MRVLGLVFAGTSTDARNQMSEFLQATFDLRPTSVGGIEADVFDLPDGASFAVADAQGMGSERSIGFLVEGLDEAVDRLRALGLAVDAEISAHARWRYAHFRAPDGHVYELVESSGGNPGGD